MPQTAPQPAVPEPRVAFEALPDRELRNPLFRWLVHLGLPLGLSLVIHVFLFGAMALKSWAVIAQKSIDVGDYNAGLIENPDDRAQDAFHWGEQPKLDTPEVKPFDELPPDFSRVDPVDAAALKDPGKGMAEGDLGLGEGRFGGLLGTGSGAGEAGSGGFGSGLGGRGGQLGQIGIWNLRVQANKVVYVVDFSGSIIVAVDDLKRELKRSIGQLKPSQSFNVILFFSEDEVAKTESFAPNLQPASEETRKALFKWLDREAPRGDTKPMPSIKRALSMRPEVIFFFSDGLFEDSVVSETTSANRGTGSRFFCLVFDEILLNDTSKMPKETEGSRRMKKIAEQNRGEVKIVTGADLGRK